MHREGRELIPTAKAFSLITLLRGLAINELTSPELTGGWEYKLSQIERGEAQPRSLHERDRRHDARHGRARQALRSPTPFPATFVTLQTPCPKCGGVVKENYKKFQCQLRLDALWKIVAGRQFEYARDRDPAARGQVGPLTGFRNKMGRLFNAAIVLNDDCSPSSTSASQGRTTRMPSRSISPPGKPRRLPEVRSRVFEHGMSYVCEKSVGPAKSCDFRSGKIILQQPIEPEQMQKLLADGKTDLLKGFVSARTAQVLGLPGARQPPGRQGRLFDIFELCSGHFWPGLFNGGKAVVKDSLPLSKKPGFPGFLLSGRCIGMTAEAFHVKPQRVAVAPGNWQESNAARTASMACRRGKVIRQTRPTVRLGCTPAKGSTLTIGSLAISGSAAVLGITATPAPLATM
jgi:hypothetical protein